MYLWEIMPLNKFLDILPLVKAVEFVSFSLYFSLVLLLKIPFFFCSVCVAYIIFEPMYYSR